MTGELFYIVKKEKKLLLIYYDGTFEYQRVLTFDGSTIMSRTMSAAAREPRNIPTGLSVSYSSVIIVNKISLIRNYFLKFYETFPCS